jgi:hypothetical protein
MDVAGWRAPSVCGVSIVTIARCPDHGLHGQRTECYACGGPVEQVEMIPAGYFSRDELELLEAAVQLASLLAQDADELAVVARKLARLARGPSVPA